MMPTIGKPEGTATETDLLELFLMRLRYKEGRLSEIGANKPLWLDDPESVWVVYSGKVDLFSVPVVRKQAAGTRRHLFRVPSGQMFFGIDWESKPTGYGLLAIGTPGTKIIKVRRSQFLALARDPIQAEAITLMLNEWVSALALVCATAIPPKDCQLLEPGEATLAASDTARAHNTVLWANHREGSSTFMGRTDLPPLSADGLFPISRETWIKATGSVSLRLIETSEFITKDPGWSSLDQFHALVLQVIALNTQKSVQAESAFLLKKMSASRRVLDASLVELASVVPGRRERPLAEDEAGEELLTACRWVGRALGITIQPHPNRETGRQRRDPLDDIAKASHIRMRQVRLKGDWWRHESGPLLGFLAEDERPVALLPAGARRYEMHDPVERTRTLVTAAVSEKLLGIAYSFYRPLSPKALSVRDLIKFGLQDGRGDLNAILLMGTFVGLLALITPYATGLLMDNVIPNADRTQLIQIGLALLASAVATMLFNVTQAIAVLRLSGKMDATLQAALWDRLMNLPVPFFRQYTAGDLASRALGISSIRQILTGITINVILSAIFSVFNLALMAWYNWTLTLVGVALVLIILLVATLLSYTQMKQQRTLMRLQGVIAGLVLQLITGVSKLRVASAERRAFSNWASEFSAQKRLAFWTRSVSNYVSVFSAFAPIATSMVIFYSISISPDWKVTAGSFVGFNAAFGQFLSAMLGMTVALVSSLNIVPIYERLRPILETLPEADEAKSDPGDLTGDIEISHVSFRYTPEGPPVLRDVSLSAKPGEFVAVVGPSGSGKSTLFRMLLGFEQPEAGAIYYEGQDLANLDVQAVRRQIGVVLQTAKLMTGDIFTNIIGSARLSMDDAWEAARMAGLDGDIKEMPMGMYTVIMEGGGNFSGGQRQRLLIARAIATKPRILLFDEATSALDNQTQQKVSRSLEAMQATRLVIAHRLSTIINADRIYVIVAGQVVQMGTYGELMKQHGPFADLVKRQVA